MGFFQRIFLHFIKNPKPFSQRPFSTSLHMSSSSASAALYAATISSSSVLGAVPEEAKDKQHHLKDGKGFRNPWDSWKAMRGPQIGRAMIKWVHPGTSNPG